jgi:hypothetical protein
LDSGYFAEALEGMLLMWLGLINCHYQNNNPRKEE